MHKPAKTGLLKLDLNKNILKPYRLISDSSIQPNVLAEMD